MKIKVLKTKKELHSLPTFSINNLLWGTQSIPLTTGQLGFLPETGFILHMNCEEKNPLRKFTQNNDPVYKDSAMEAFFKFSSPTAPNIYLNFEMNANGALLAMYGSSRNERTYFSQNQIQQCNCHAEILPESWSITLTIPISVLEEVYGSLELINEVSFSCNFYKISEDESHQHYASFSPIDSPEPNFHLPEFFEPCVLYT